MRIVTAYYKIPSKQPHAFYIKNILNFFKYIKAPVLFFTDQDIFNELSVLSPTNIEFCIKPFEDMAVFKEHPIPFWKTQIRRDPEQYHTWQLGAVWANKKYFVKGASDLYPDEWFLWVDAGCIRKESWKEYAEKTALRNYPLEPGVYTQCLRPIDKTVFKYPDQYIAGALIAFHRDYINKYIEAYNTTLNLYNLTGIPGTMDQYIMASLKYSTSVLSTFVHFIEIKQMTDYVQGCPDAWFFFLALL